VKTVWIVGVGTGPDTLTREAARAVETAQVLFGAPRLLAAYAPDGAPQEPLYTPETIAPVVAASGCDRFAVLVSGDTGFYSAALRLCAELTGCEIKVLPGVSSLNCFFARIARPWQNAALVSCHGRGANLVDTVRRNAETFALTGGNVPQLAAALCDAGFGDLTATVGQELGLPGERIDRMSVRALARAEISPLSVLLIDNPAPDARARTGIPDGEFIRGDVPMTKSPVRAVTMSRLAVRPEDLCFDIGAGTGSVTVEMALAAYRGHVWAIDKNPEAVSLTRKNCAAFHLGNVTALHAGALEALGELPAPDAVFLGGSGGGMRQLVDLVLSKNPNARIVANAIALESAQAALEALEAHGLETELLQIGTGIGRRVAGLHMMTAQNPIFIVTGGPSHE